MTWLQLWVLALPLGLVTFKAQPASAQIPTTIYPLPTMSPEDEGVPITSEPSDQAITRSEKENEETTKKPKNGGSGKQQDCPVPVEEYQRLLDENNELHQRIQVLEQANHTLTMTITKNTTSEEGTIDTWGGNSANGITISRPADCADHLVLGATKSGIYEVYPFTCLCSKPVRVYCDMETDGGGWTVFMSRLQAGNAVNFNRSWSEYRTGFGDPLGEFWLGNEHLHTMTSSKEYALRMDVHLATGDIRLGLWDSFRVLSEVNRYKIMLTSYSTESTMYSNCLPNLNNQYFSTYDRDNDGYSGNCAITHGGFWHYQCSNPFHPTSSLDTGLNSNCFNQQRQGASFVQMKFRPVVCGSTLKTIYLNSYECARCH
ncbi:ficolin-2-like isoform X2 [Palaemon carinicauda]|uniref:ficolin-2-like isoform X2 n=1 Tax=Palaemon carinicauda TaxID=392227 RepID=UPI0035B65A3F